MPMYKVVACDGHKGNSPAEARDSCGWVLGCNGIGNVIRSCPECGGLTRSAQASDPRELSEWLLDRELRSPSWLLNSVPIG